MSSSKVHAVGIWFCASFLWVITKSLNRFCSVNYSHALGVHVRPVMEYQRDVKV